MPQEMGSNGSTIQESDKKIIRIKATFSYFENIAPLLILPFLLLWFLHYYYYGSCIIIISLSPAPFISPN
jgi:hypothetical protein